MAGPRYRRSLRPRHPKPENWRPQFSGGRCGAWAGSVKRGCRRWPVPGERRCRLHGGIKGELSSNGKKAISEASKREWRAWRAQIGLPPDWRSRDNQVCRQKRESAAAYLEKHGPVSEEPLS